MKRILAVILTVLLVFVLAACNSDPDNDTASAGSAGDSTIVGSGDMRTTDDDTIKVGLIQPGKTHTFYVGIERGATRASNDLGFELISTSGDDDLTTQLNVFNNLVEQGVDLISINPIDIDAFHNAFRDAKTRGVKIISMFSETEYKDAQIGFSEYEVAYAIGEFGVGFLTERYGEPKGKVAIITGLLGQDINDGRTQGFIDAVEEAGIEVVAVEAADFQGAKAVAVMENYLTAYPDLDLVYSGSDDMSLPAAGVIADAGKSDQIKVLSIDGSDDGLQAIQDGTLLCSWANCSQVFGYRLGQLMNDVVRNDSSDFVQYMGLNVTAENVEDYRAFNTYVVENIDTMEFPEQLTLPSLFEDWLANNR